MIDLSDFLKHNKQFPVYIVRDSMRIPNVQMNNNNGSTRNRWASAQIPSPRHDGCVFACNKSCPARQKRWTLTPNLHIGNLRWSPKKPLILYKSSQLIPKTWWENPSEINPPVINSGSLDPKMLQSKVPRAWRHWHYSQQEKLPPLLRQSEWVLRVGVASGKNFTSKVL